MHAENGFTLIELLIGIAVSAIAMTAVYHFYITQVETRVIQEQVAAMQQNIRVAMSVIERDIRMAGYDPDPSDNKTPGIITAVSDQIKLSYMGDCDGSNNDDTGGVDDAGEDRLMATVTYVLGDAGGGYDADTDKDDLKRVFKRRETSGESHRYFALNIEKIEFFYHMKDGGLTLSPTANRDITGVEITLLARTAKADPHYTNNETYKTPGNQIWRGDNDGYRRLMMSQLVSCRNM
ncbi:MAG: hypothetical protein CSA22_06985 [Deltaproteobacteria bacterium]|nr:MAG: hypothetical protein CSA22_06985 [Deltaproteobacteria bacterium]